MKLIGPGGYFTSYPEQILRLKQEYPELFEDGVDQIEQLVGAEIRELETPCKELLQTFNKRTHYPKVSNINVDVKRRPHQSRIKTERIGIEF